MNANLSDKVEKVSYALSRLKESLSKEDNPFYVDTTLKRFELTFDMAWKAMQKALYAEGLECYSPRDCLKKGFQSATIDNEEIWLTMLRDRNRSTHIYNEADANSICRNIINDYYPALVGLYQTLTEKVKQL